jgi:hypothetical protein
MDDRTMFVLGVLRMYLQQQGPGCLEASLPATGRGGVLRQLRQIVGNHVITAPDGQARNRPSALLTASMQITDGQLNARCVSHSQVRAWDFAGECITIRSLHGNVRPPVVIENQHLSQPSQ